MKRWTTVCQMPIVLNIGFQTPKFLLTPGFQTPKFLLTPGGLAAPRGRSFFVGVLYTDKEWVLDRMRELAGLSTIEVCGYSRAPGLNRGAAASQSIELGGNGAWLRSAIQAGGGEVELACRCRGTLLEALVPGQGGGPNGLSVVPRLSKPTHQ
jgi:hypothetical protein